MDPLPPDARRTAANSLAPAPAALPPGGALSLLPLVEARLAGQRVAVLGDALSGLGPALAARGARVVAVLDDDATRVAEAMVTQARRGVTFGVREEQAPLLRPGSFDLVIVPELDAHADPAEVVEFARGVCPTGTVIFGARADGPLGYYDLHGAVSPAFDEVKMVGRLPWRGVAYVDFAQGGDGEVMVDTSLREDREPEHHFAFCAARPLSLPAYALVATDVPDPAPVADEAEKAESQAKILALSAEVERGREERRALEARLADLDRKLATTASALSEAQAQAARVPEVRETVVQDTAASARVAELEALLLRAEARARDAERTLAAVNVKAGAERDASQRAAAHAKSRVAELEAELERAKSRPAAPVRTEADEARLAELTRELEAVRRAATSAEARQREVEKELAAARTELGTVTREKGRLVDALAEKERALAAAVAEAEEASRARTDAGPDEDTQALEEELARAEDRLRDRAREIGELRRQLEDRASLVQELLAKVDALEAADARADVAAARGEAAALRAELERERAARLAEGTLRGPPGGLLTYPRG